MAEIRLCSSGSNFLFVLSTVLVKRGGTLFTAAHFCLSLLSFLFFSSSCLPFLHPRPQCSLSFFFLFFNVSPFFPSSLSFCLISSPSQSSYPHFCLLHSSLYLSGSCPTIYSVTAVQPVSHCQAEAHGQYSYDGTCLYYLLSSACFAFRGTKLSKLNLVPAL